jgi:hypothetical protein
MAELPGMWAEASEHWARNIPSVPGQRRLSLRVSPDPADEDEPWTWEVLEVEDATTEYEIDLGGATSLEAAKSAAELTANMHLKRAVSYNFVIEMTLGCAKSRNRLQSTLKKFGRTMRFFVAGR